MTINQKAIDIDGGKMMFEGKTSDIEQDKQLEIKTGNVHSDPSGIEDETSNSKNWLIIEKMEKQIKLLEDKVELLTSRLKSLEENASSQPQNPSDFFHNPDKLSASLHKTKLVTFNLQDALDEVDREGQVKNESSLEVKSNLLDAVERFIGSSEEEPLEDETIEINTIEDLEATLYSTQEVLRALKKLKREMSAKSEVSNYWTLSRHLEKERGNTSSNWSQPTWTQTRFENNLISAQLSVLQDFSKIMSGNMKYNGFFDIGIKEDVSRTKLISKSKLSSEVTRSNLEAKMKKKPKAFEKSFPSEKQFEPIQKKNFVIEEVSEPKDIDPLYEEGAYVDSQVDPEVQALRKKYIVGRLAGENLYDRHSHLIIAKNEKITADTVSKADSEGKLAELIVHMILE